MGFVFGEQSYCRSKWNILDGVLVLLSIVHIIIKAAHPAGEHHMMGILKVLRLLRTLRPLRSISCLSV